MSAPAKPDQVAELAQMDALRAADLSELLGHVNARWDDERRALARQLHDSLGSSLTALTMHLALLVQQLPPERTVLERAAKMKQLLMSVIDTNRQMQVRLWNDKLEFLGVTVALGELAAQFGLQHQIAVRCSMPEDELICPRSHGVALLRTLEEGLSNIVAHAQASEVDIIVNDNDEAVMLTVKDNGIGFQNGNVMQTGKHGLRAVRERVHYLGGMLTLAPNQGPGATLSVSLPKQREPLNGAI